MRYTGIAISPVAGGVTPDGPQDIYVDGTNNLAMVYDAEAVAQHARQRLKTFFGEWFLDTEAGVRWLQDILGHRENLVLAEALMKGEVLDTAGVTGINEFAIKFDRATRGVLVNKCDVATELDE